MKISGGGVGKKPSKDDLHNLYWQGHLRRNLNRRAASNERSSKLPGSKLHKALNTKAVF